MDRKELTDLAREVCSESNSLIMEVTKKFYFKVSRRLSEQSWDEAIYGDDFNELWDDSLWRLQSLVSSQIANNLNDLFDNVAYLEDMENQNLSQEDVRR